MLRCLLSCSALLLFTAALPAKEIRVLWHGQSFFEIKAGGKTIAIDPHFLEAYGRREVKADVLLVTHFHIDHASVDQIVDFADRVKQKKLLVLTGLKNDRGIGGNRDQDQFNEFDEKFDNLRVKCVATYHDDVGGLKRGKNGVMILEVDGLRICHLGDLGHTLTDAQVKKIGKVDVLMIPVGGSYTLNGSEAKKVVEQLKPTRYVIPMHYGTKVYEDLLTAEEFLDEQKEGTVKTFKHNELVIDTEAEVPKDPIIAVLGYEPKEAKPEK